ncbi:hypothetical protein [uncultured Maribacter sp.]|uniref:hypothetical protein n=1 Tax=uncultured Maribacter sp. TaxID=431308 RepID=UPI0026143C29|nr:hypothetical protein [uncultured Maribacter sp.]
MKKQLLNKNIENFYNNASEEDRLTNGMGVFEFERVKELIAKYITCTPLKIIDVGGGTVNNQSGLQKICSAN